MGKGATEKGFGDIDIAMDFSLVHTSLVTCLSGALVEPTSPYAILLRLSLSVESQDLSISTGVSEPLSAGTERAFSASTS